jgi:hypothetical protein
LRKCYRSDLKHIVNSFIPNISAFFQSIAFAMNFEKSFILKIKHLQLILTYLFKSNRKNKVQMAKINDIKNLTRDILKVTSKIQEKFPELYVLLGETPLFLNRSKRTIETSDFEQYLTSLKMQLKTFEKCD